MSYHHHNETQETTQHSALRSIAIKGYDVFFEKPNTVERLKCKVCDSVCNVNRNAYGPTGHLSAMSGNLVLHDHFYCPNIGKQWHDSALDLVQEIDRTQSNRVKKLITKDLCKVLSKKQKIQSN